MQNCSDKYEMLWYWAFLFFICSLCTHFPTSLEQKPHENMGKVTAHSLLSVIHFLQHYTPLHPLNNRCKTSLTAVPDFLSTFFSQLGGDIGGSPSVSQNVFSKVHPDFDKCAPFSYYSRLASTQGLSFINHRGFWRAVKLHLHFFPCNFSARLFPGGLLTV